MNGRALDRIVYMVQSKGSDAARGRSKSALLALGLGRLLHGLLHRLLGRDLLDRLLDRLFHG